MKLEYFKKTVIFNPLFLIVLFAFAIRTIFLFSYHQVWWDASSIIGMGKFIFSFGDVGFYEYTRPFVWPFFMGLFWKIGNVFFIGTIVEILLSLGIVALTYLISDKLFSRRVAIISSFFVSISPILFFFSYRLYTEIPALFFAMLGIYLFIIGYNYWSGFFMCISFLTRYPQGAIMFGLFLVLFYGVIYFKKNYSFSSIIKYVSGILTLLIPFIIANIIVYYDPLFSITSADSIIHYSGWIFFEPWHYYFTNFVILSSILLFLPFGVYFIFKSCKQIKENKPNKQNKKNIKSNFVGYLSILIPALLIFLYYSILSHKELRFAISFIPMFVIVSVYGYERLFGRVFSGLFSRRYIMISNVIILLLFIVSLFYCFNYYLSNEPKSPDWRENQYFSYLKDRTVYGEVLTTNPYVTIYQDRQYTLLYYPVWDSKLAQYWTEYVNQNYARINYVFIDTCEGGMLCPPSDISCTAMTDNFVDALNIDFTRVYYMDTGRCKYSIYYTHITRK